MNAIAEWTLASLADYGAPMLLFFAYIGSLGIPFPVTMVIIAAGAFTRLGLLDWRLAVLACLVGASLADQSEYLLGRLAHPWLKRRFGQKAAWQQAQNTIQRQGSWAILLTRFWLTPLAPAVNVMAGIRYPFIQFLLYDLVGQLLWVLLYGGLGYLFATQLEWLSGAASTFTAISMGLTVLGFGVYWLILRRKTGSEVHGGV